MPGDASVAPANEKVEVAPFVGLQYALDVEALVAAFRRCPASTADRKFVVRNQKLQLPRQQHRLLCPP